MRPLIIKDKYVGKDKIDSYKDFVLEDKYLIKEVEEGFKVEGKIYLRGKISYLDDEEEIYTGNMFENFDQMLEKSNRK